MEKYLILEINNFVVPALIDTGAMISIMCKDTVDLLGIQSYIDTTSSFDYCGSTGCSRTIGSIFDMDIIIDGKLNTQISFGIIPHRDNCQLSIILGMDFFVTHSCIINFITDKITIEGIELEFPGAIKAHKLKKKPCNKWIYMIKDYFHICKNKNKNEYEKMRDTLNKIISNILQHPSVFEYKSICKKVIDERFQHASLFINILSTLGFVQMEDRYVYLQEDDTVLSHVQKGLVKAQ